MIRKIFFSAFWAIIVWVLGGVVIGICFGIYFSFCHLTECQPATDCHPLIFAVIGLLPMCFGIATLLAGLCGRLPMDWSQSWSVIRRILMSALWGIIAMMATAILMGLIYGMSYMFNRQHSEDEIYQFVRLAGSIPFLIGLTTFSLGLLGRSLPGTRPR